MPSAIRLLLGRLFLGVLGTFALAWSADAASVSGTVVGPDGKAFRGAFVQARNAKTRITVCVLSGAVIAILGSIPPGPVSGQPQITRD